MAPSSTDDIIDVDAMPTNVFVSVASSINDHFKEIDCTKSLIVFLHYITNLSLDLPSTTQVIVTNPPFSIIPLFYLRGVSRSQLLQQLSQRTLPSSVSPCILNGIQLPSLMRFHVCHLSFNSEIIDYRTRSKNENKERNKLKKFFPLCFDQFLLDDHRAIDQSLKRGNALYICGMDNSGKSSHIIAAVLYISTKDGSYINWLAVTRSNFDKLRFGRLATDKPFSGMGLASFLLQMVQLQAVIKNWSLSVYLQANMDSKAAMWYENRGFVRVENDPSCLPGSLLECYNESKVDNMKYQFVHFVTTADLIEDLKQRGLDPDDEEVRVQLLNLVKLIGPIQMNICSMDVAIEDVQVEKQPCIPASLDSSFLKFPFNETAEHLNKASNGLVIFDNPSFQFSDAGNEIRETPNVRIRDKFVHDVSRAFNTVTISTQTYLLFKSDVDKEKYQKWFNDEIIEFFSFWMMRDVQNPLVQATEIISPLVTRQVQIFYNYYCGPLHQGLSSTNPIEELNLMFQVKQIDLYLRSHPDVLTKKFVFFVQNEKNSHWWGWAAINPWVQIAKVLDEQFPLVDQEQEAEYSNYSEYIHGLLACDGYNTNKTFLDSWCFIWFLNLASAYRDMRLEGMLDNFDFMNHTSKSYWLLGARGPFGIIDFLKKDRKRFPILKMHEAIIPIQKDKCNCGVIWCLFIYDLMMQASIPYNQDLSMSPNYLPISMNIGKTWMEPNVFARLKAEPFSHDYKDKTWRKQKIIYTQNIYKILREEIVVCLERLRLLRLQNMFLPKHIQKPEGWGLIPERYEPLIHTNLIPHLQLPQTSESVKLALKAEILFRNKILEESEPIIPGGLLVGATPEILGNVIINYIYPNTALTGGEDDEWALPFDESLFLEEVKRFINDTKTPNIPLSSDMTMVKDGLPTKMRKEKVIADKGTSSDQGDLKQDESQSSVNKQSELHQDDSGDKATDMIIARLLESDLQELEVPTPQHEKQTIGQEHFGGKTLQPGDVSDHTATSYEYTESSEGENVNNSAVSEVVCTKKATITQEASHAKVASMQATSLQPFQKKHSLQWTREDFKIKKGKRIPIHLMRLKSQKISCL